MKKTIIAFDCDGTLISSEALNNKKIIANERIRTLLITLARFKNVKIVVWSGSGEIWARQVGAALGIDSYVWKYCSKNSVQNDSGEQVFSPELTPDIAIDDVQACSLGVANLIVREK